jgi:hypothetical protein
MVRLRAIVFRRLFMKGQIARPTNSPTANTISAGRTRRRAATPECAPASIRHFSFFKNPASI